MYTSELNGEKITLWKDIERTEKELIAKKSYPSGNILFRESLRKRKEALIYKRRY